MGRRRFVRAPAFSATDSRMTAPAIACCQNGDTWMTGSAALTTPMNSTPAIAPHTLPMPPAMLTPPMTQAAITVSSKPAASSVNAIA